MTSHQAIPNGIVDLPGPRRRLPVEVVVRVAVVVPGRRMAMAMGMGHLTGPLATSDFSRRGPGGNLMMTQMMTMNQRRTTELVALDGAGSSIRSPMRSNAVSFLSRHSTELGRTPCSKTSTQPVAAAMIRLSSGPWLLRT